MRLQKLYNEGLHDLLLATFYQDNQTNLGMWHAEEKNSFTLHMGKHEGKSHLVVLGVDGRINLKKVKKVKTSLSTPYRHIEGLEM
jgi:hypothetical protein